jgi:hypothetical protein
MNQEVDGMPNSMRSHGSAHTPGLAAATPAKGEQPRHHRGGSWRISRSLKEPVGTLHRFAARLRGEVSADLLSAEHLLGFNART